MSLINKMLRDLDARHAPNEQRTALPRDVHLHELPPAPESLWVPAVLALTLALAAGWFFLAGRGEPALAPAPQAPQPVAAPPTPAPAAVVESKPAPESVAAKTPSAPVAADSVRKKVPVTSLKLETQLPHTAAATPGEPPAAHPAHAAPVAAAAPLAAVAPAAPVKPPTAAKESASAGGPTSIDKSPRTAPANEAAENEYRKALSALRRGGVNEAVEGFRSTLRIDGHHLKARQALLSQLVALQQWPDAQTVMEEGLALDPEQTGWAMALARLQLENGKLDEAAQTLAQHARYADQNPEYLAFQALLLQKQKRSGEAAARYRAALALRPQESRWWYGLGLALEADQKPQEARAAFQQAKDTGNLPAELTGAVEQRLR